MWALLPLCAELGTTDNLMLSYWISVEQQRYSRVWVDDKKYTLRRLFSGGRLLSTINLQESKKKNHTKNKKPGRLGS